jgi:glutaredoxin 3
VRNKHPVLTLYQAEWCPYSARIRQRLTELGVDFVARQVAAEPEDREDMRRAIGTDEIPVLVTDEGEKLEGEDAALRYLDERYEERNDAARHREKSVEEADERDPRT